MILFAGALILVIILLFFVVDSARRARADALLSQKAEFLSVASHQIRTPLTGIRWAVEQVLNSNESTLGPRDREILSLTYESSLDLIGRVNNLLDVTSLEERGAPVRSNQSVLMRPLFEAIVASLTLSAQRKKVRMVMEDTMPADLELTSDRQMMQHIFFNVLSNAVKYTRPDTVITVSYEWTPGGHQFTITDHGLGIPPAEQQLIFAGYHRTQQAVESGEAGSGLGLYLTKRLVTLLGGSVSVRSKIGEGSAFTVTFTPSADAREQGSLLP